MLYPLFCLSTLFVRCLLSEDQGGALRKYLVGVFSEEARRRRAETKNIISIERLSFKELDFHFFLDEKTKQKNHGYMYLTVNLAFKA